MCACGEGAQGVSVVGGFSECWPISVGGSWDPADWSFREDLLPRRAVKQLNRRLFPGCVSVWVWVCESVCVRMLLFIYLGEDHFEFWTMGSEDIFVPTCVKVWHSVMVEDRPTLKCVLLYFTGMFGLCRWKWKRPLSVKPVRHVMHAHHSAQWSSNIQLQGQWADDMFEWSVFQRRMQFGLVMIKAGAWCQWQSSQV